MNEREAYNKLRSFIGIYDDDCTMILDLKPLREVMDWLKTRLEIKELCDDPSNLSASDAPYFKKVANLYAQDAHFGLEVFMRHGTELCILHHAIMDARKAKMYFEMKEGKHD